MPPRPNTEVQAVDLPDVGALAVETAKSVVKNRPVSVSLWAFGLLLAAFASGFAVSEERKGQYDLTMRSAGRIEDELHRAFREVHAAEQNYYRSKGWFGKCDRVCQQKQHKYNHAVSAAEGVKAKYDQVVTEARREVGIWSTYGVTDVRNAFWSAWQSGKDFAARLTMWDAMFMAVGGREETLVSMALKLFFQYIMNLTIGLVGMLFYFVYNVYTLVVSYGEPAISGLAYFLLVLVAGLATVGTYLFAIYGTIAGGAVYLIKQGVQQQAMEGGRPGGRPRPVQYGGHHARAHYD